VIDLPVTEHGASWTIRASWVQNGGWAVDLVAFLVDSDEQVEGDDDFVFYNQPETSGTRLTVDGPNEQSVAVRLDQLPGHCRRIVLAAALDGAGVTFGEVGALELEVAPGADAGIVARATLDAATEERTLVLAEIYLRGDVWRLRAVGQGYPTDLAALACAYGVDVDE
ncbi:TerD family protein, partial [Streptomyces roseolus]|uniref:TerD family protein n=1 Tax=Streptomyces roseolus TaxID=67358 RepID=UPI003657063C